MLSPDGGGRNSIFPPLGGRCPRGAGEARNADFGRVPEGNLIDAGGVVAAPPHYPPLVEPLRPGPTLVPPTPSNRLSNLLSVSPTPAPTLLFFFALLPAARLLSLLLVPPMLPPLPSLRLSQSPPLLAPLPSLLPLPLPLPWVSPPPLPPRFESSG